MPYLLNALYLLLVALASPWLLYAAWKKGKYRAGGSEKFWGRVPAREGDRRCAWFHAVSVGEVNLLATIVAEFERRHPDWDCVISSTSAAGHALAKQKYPRHSVFYCPLDFSWAVRTALRRIRPDLLVLAELELWPNLIRAAREEGTKVCVINGRLSEKSFRRYRWVRPMIRSWLAKIDAIAVQNQEYADRFLALGALPDRVHVSGSLKFDGAITDRKHATVRKLRELAGIADGDTIFLAGSTQAPEEAWALQTWRTLSAEHPALRLIVVPRHPERFEEVAELLSEAGVPWRRRSELSGADQRDHANWRVLLVDTVGELGAWWGTAKIAFVGGSFGSRGGQNMIEPAAFGAAVSFGPNTWNFRDVVALLLHAEAAVVLPDEQALTAFVERCLKDPRYAALLGEQAQAVVRPNLGATEKTLAMLEGLLAAATPTLSRAA